MCDESKKQISYLQAHKYELVNNYSDFFSTYLIIKSFIF